MARDLERTHGWPMERTRLIYNGVDFAASRPANREQHRDAVRSGCNVREDELLVLFVAHNSRSRGCRHSFAPVGQLAPGRTSRCGCGRSAMRTRENTPGRLVATAPARSIEFLGAIEDTAPFYAAADVFALPTWYDSCSLVVLEALASGVPVITSSHNGASELLTAGRDGFVVDDPGDWQQTANHLVGLLDAATRERMGAAARHLAERHPVEANYRQVMALWQQIAGRMHRAA